MMTNYGLDRRNQEARAGTQTSRKEKMMSNNPTDALRALLLDCRNYIDKDRYSPWDWDEMVSKVEFQIAALDTVEASHDDPELISNPAPGSTLR